MHITQSDIHRNLGVMLEEIKGSRNILRGFQMVSVQVLWVCLVSILVSTHVRAQSLDTTNVKNRKYFLQIESNLHKQEVVTMAEIIRIDQINNFVTQVENTLGAVKTLMEFSPTHNSCFHQSNSFLD